MQKHKDKKEEAFYRFLRCTLTMAAVASFPANFGSPLMINMIESSVVLMMKLSPSFHIEFLNARNKIMHHKTIAYEMSGLRWNYDFYFLSCHNFFVLIVNKTRTVSVESH